MRVLIADDQEFIRRDLCAVLCAAKDVEVAPKPLMAVTSPEECTRVKDSFPGETRFALGPFLG
jgi:hypothetical protein